MMLQMQSALGLVLLPFLAWILSEARGDLPILRVLLFGALCLGVQIGLAALLLFVPGSQTFFWAMSQGVVALQAATEQGLRVVFGYLSGGPAPFDMTNPQNGYLLAFRGLPLVIIISVLTRLLFLWGVLQAVVKAMSWCLQRLLGISGAVGTASAANVFVGMVEAPVLVRPYLKTMSRGGLFAVMTVGMSTVAGTVLGLYASVLGDSIPGAAGHLLVASLISLPAALLIAWLMVPVRDDEDPDQIDLADFGETRGTMDAIAQGTFDGVRLAVLITAMLVVMVALVSLLNMIIGSVAGVFGYSLSFEQMVGWIAAPFAWIIGIPTTEIFTAGSLIGVKVVLNEFLAYLQLAAVPDGELSERSRLILTYVLCGFANFGSLGIMTGGLVALVPERREDIVSLGPKTILSGMMATLMTGAVVGILTV